MAQVIGESVDSLTVQTDDGRIIQVAKSGLNNPESLGLGGPASPPPPEPVPGYDAFRQNFTTDKPNLPSAGIVPTAASPQPEPSAAPQPPVEAPKKAAPTMQSQLDQSYQQEGAGIQAQAKAQQAAAQQEAILRKQAADAQQIQLQDSQARMQEGRAHAEKQFAKTQESMDKFLNTSVDPDHFWTEKSVGTKIGAAIAIGLGAFGAGLQGSNQNQALNIINDAIHRDMEAQKIDIEKKGRVANMNQQLYSDLRAKLHDDHLTDLSYMDASYKNVEQKIAASAAEFKSPQLQAQAQQLLAQVGQKRLQFQEEIKGKVLDNYLKANPQMDSDQLLAATQAKQASEAIGVVADPKTLREAGAIFSGGKQEKAIDDSARYLFSVVKKGEPFKEKDFQEFKTSFMPTPSDTPERREMKTRILNQMVLRNVGKVSNRTPTQAIGQSPFQDSGYSSYVRLPNGKLAEVSRE